MFPIRAFYVSAIKQKRYNFRQDEYGFNDNGFILYNLIFLVIILWILLFFFQIVCHWQFLLRCIVS